MNPVLALIIFVALVVVGCSAWMSDAIYDAGKAAYERENPE